VADANSWQQPTWHSGSLSHNGDDAIGLYNGTTLLDLFGDIGCDPGTEWTTVLRLELKMEIL
jgi:hypothetical protein